MDEVTFDKLTRDLATATSRRRLLRGLVGGVLGGLSGAVGRAGAASCREAGRLCNQGADCCAGFCDTSNPDPKRRNRCTCPAGTFECRGGCKTAADYRDDVENCGGCGRRCPAPVNGVSVCVDGSCGLVCDAGYHQCGSRCVSNTDLALCGNSCTPCPVPANGRATCDGINCGIVCDAGFHTCDGATCVGDDHPDHCGTRCAPCAAPANATATCDGANCGFVCNDGFTRQGDFCCPDDCAGACCNGVCCNGGQICGQLVFGGTACCYPPGTSGDCTFANYESVCCVTGSSVGCDLSTGTCGV